MKTKTTIKDIASKLNISATAVSKALNNHSDISDALKRKVHKTAKELNYTPNAIAKRLVTNKSSTLGCFMLSRDDIKEETFGFHLIGGIMEEANKNDYDILLFTTNSDKEQRQHYIQMCLERQVEGAIFTGLRLDDPYLKEITEAPFPVVIVDTELFGENIYCVTSENRSGIIKAMDYLWDLGHRKIAMITGHAYAQITQVRFNAYHEFLENKDVFDERLVFAGDFTKQSGYRAAKQIVALQIQPSAVLVSSDLMALGAIQAFKESGLRIPKDISVIGMDNILACEFIEPHLTTIGQNPFKMGEVAVQTLIASLGPEQLSLPHRYLLEMELIIRNSCGPNYLR